jgi:Trm5-related predicted tRNA methylase
MRAWLTSRVGITRLELYAVFGAIVLTVAAGLQVVNHWNHQAQSAAKTAQAVAVVQKLRAEKVCSESNQGQACRDLFHRLVNNADPEIRREFGCLVARELHRPDLASKIDCQGIPGP